jgi:hypothetical protein
MKYFIQRLNHLKNSGVECGWGNGYVIVPPAHPAYELDYGDIDVDIHGGLTFSQKVTNDMLELFPALDTNDVGGWMVGFDTAHYGDDEYKWPMEAVQMETERLVLQLENYTKKLTE